MDNRIGLTEAQLERLAPSVFAARPVKEVSGRYCFVPTIKVVEALGRRDWFPVQAGQAKAKTPENMVYKKHLIRFENAGFPAIDGVLPEIVLFNSHDRTSSFCLMSGLFRIACLNGLLVYDEMFSVFVIRHIGYRDKEIYEAESRLTDEVPLISRRMSELKSMALTREEKTWFARSAAAMRWGEKMPDIDPLSLLNPQREEDATDTLWNTYNVIQENLCKGGVPGFSHNNKKRRRITTREIKSVSEQVRVNKSLWQIAERLRTIKEERGR